MAFCCGCGSKNDTSAHVSSRRWTETKEAQEETRVEVDDNCDVVVIQTDDGPFSMPSLSPAASLTQDGHCDIQSKWSNAHIEHTECKRKRHEHLETSNNRACMLQQPENTPNQIRTQTGRYHMEDKFWKDEQNRRPSRISGDRFMAMAHLHEYGDLAGKIVARAMELVDLVDAEDKDVSDHNWNGPCDKKEHLIDWMLNDLAFTGCETREEAVKSLAEAVEEILAGQETLVQLRAPVKIFGDIHGQLRDVLLFFNEFGKPTVGRNGDIEMVSYVFNGDWVDRGVHQVEVVVLLFALKVTYPERIWLIRGNHEDAAQNKSMKSHGFHDACCKCFGFEDGDRIFHAVHRAFNQLPVAATVEDRVLVVHGGIGDGRWKFKQLLNKKRPLTHDQLVADKLLYNILWSDPVPENDNGSDPNEKTNATFGVHKSTRGQCKVLKRFGCDITMAFCASNDLGLIVRSHQCSSHGYGYTLMHKGHLLRVFSARNYDNSYGNAAAMLLVGYKKFLGIGYRGLVVRAKVIRPPPGPPKRKSARSLPTSFDREADIDKDLYSSPPLFERQRSGDSTGSLESRDSSEIDVATEEAEAAVPTAEQKKTGRSRKDLGVEVDQDCDVVNKSEKGREGHKFHSQTWQSDDKTSCEKLHSDAVVGRISLCGDRFVGPRDSCGQLAAALVERVMELVDVVENENQDVLEQHWQPLDVEGGDIFSWLFASESVQKLTMGKTLSRPMLELCHTAKGILLKQPTLVALRAPVKVFGDIRGHLRDLLLFFDEYGRPTVGRGGDIEVVSYVFNGGWIGENAHQLEVVTALLSLKVTYPERVWLLRGSPEGLLENSSRHRKDFNEACARVFNDDEIGKEVSDAIFEVFDCCPLAATIENNVLVVHGGIGDGSWGLDELQRQSRPITAETLSVNPLLNNVLWSQPHADEHALSASVLSEQTELPSGGLSSLAVVDAAPARAKSTASLSVGMSTPHMENVLRQVITQFSRDDTANFCKRNGIGLVIRSHQCVLHGFGYSLMHDGRLLRVFSARNYQGGRNNAAAILLVSYKRLRCQGNRGLMVRAKVISAPVTPGPPATPPKRAMVKDAPKMPKNEFETKSLSTPPSCQESERANSCTVSTACATNEIFSLHSPLVQRKGIRSKAADFWNWRCESRNAKAARSSEQNLSAGKTKLVDADDTDAPTQPLVGGKHNDVKRKMPSCFACVGCLRFPHQQGG